MSISNIYTKLKTYWAAFLAALVFFILGVSTVYGVAIWYIAATNLSTLKLGLAGLATIIGLLELVESYRLCRLPFKHKNG
jgi:MFS-type transporter involved in bile tolerance (Atg22 family)